MNKIPQNYKPILGLKETQVALDFINKKLFDILIDKFNLLHIRKPMISVRRQSTETYNLAGARTINYDSIHSDDIFHLYNMFNYFLINSVKKLNIENNHGVITKLNYINRDEEISNIVSMEKNVLSIEYRYDNKKKAYDKLSNIIDEVYLALTTVFDDLKFEFKQLKHSLSPRLKTIILKAEKEASVSKEALIEKYSSENGVFKLLSTQVEEEAEIDTSNQIEKIDLFFYSRRDSKPMNVVAGHLRQDYDLLKQKDSLNDTLKEEVKHADTLLMKDVYNTINISINLDQVAMFFLDKVHILEVQSGLNSKDLENIFESKGIEHL